MEKTLKPFLFALGVSVVDSSAFEGHDCYHRDTESTEN